MNTLNLIDIGDLVRQEDFDIGIFSEAQIANDGSLLVFERPKKYSPLDLFGGDDWGWLTHSTLLSLKSLASVIGATYPLVFNGVTYIVRFRTEDIPVISAEPLLFKSSMQSGDFYNNIFLKLMEV